MAFADVRLDSGLIILGTEGGPQYNTEIVELNSGAEQRNRVWAYGRGKWDLGERKYTGTTTAALRGFFRARGGRFEGFRFKDWGDYTASATPVTKAASVYSTDTITEQGKLALLTGSTWQLTKTYTSGPSTDIRLITKPVANTISVYKNGALVVTAWTLDATKGTVTFLVAPPLNTDVMTWSGEFDVPVRFDTDEFRAELLAGNAQLTNPPTLGETYFYVRHLPLIEVKI